MPILKIEKLTKKYGKTYALNGLDMEVKKGDIYGFVGPNGAGKTTTLRIISGLLKSDGGDLWLDGADDKKYSEAEKPDRLCA
ncbi:MAG: ATP-binding cassette domain-containing protein [Clostridia bacterium]